MAEGSIYPKVDGVWRFILDERKDFFQRFIREYETIRQAEGRGSADRAYYRALPFAQPILGDPGSHAPRGIPSPGKFQRDWQIRARTFLTFYEKILLPVEQQKLNPLKILDLGAGNGWLANRLALRGHLVAAVDLLVNQWDGLGAYVHYGTSFTPVQAEFNHLPFAAGEADLVIFNASFHYSPAYEKTLSEAFRILQPEGAVVILDSPVYRDPSSGVQMVLERETQFEQQYGFRSDALSSENFLTTLRLETLAKALGVSWQIDVPFYGVRWALRPWIARLRGGREPARFFIITGRRCNPSL
jgi:SAM-dependent methyltransferase